MKNKKLLTVILTATMLTSSCVSVLAASSNREAWNNAASSKETETVLENGEKVYPNVYANSEEWTAWKEKWNSIKSNYEQIALTPGADSTKLNFAWYSKTQETPVVRFLDNNGNEISRFEGEQGSDSITLEGVTYYPNKVTATNLTENTSYHYQYLLNGEWSETYDYNTQSTDKFQCLYVGDPQIGASTGQEATEENTFADSKEYYARNDAYNWNKTLESALSAHPNVSFMLSAGDQINETSKTGDEEQLLRQQIEYSGFLYSPILRSLPIATTIGNHDSKTVNYKNHFNNPNSYTEEVGASVAGNDYYYRYGNALFIIINTNNYNCQTHKDLINKAINDEANQGVKWKILMFHQDIYGSGYDHSDSDGMILRTQLTPIIDEADIDVVLQGHDHTYSRTFQLKGDGEQHPAFENTDSEDFITENATCYDILSNTNTENKVINPEGTAYMEANSSSGSKFYQLIGTQQDYIATRSQSWRPTYSTIDIDEVSFTINTYDAATNELLIGDNGVPSTYTIVKSIDKSNLTEKISEAEKITNDDNTYTSESFEKLQEVIAKAKELEQNPEATTVDVASAYTSLSDAINSLVKVSNNNNNSNTDNNNNSSSNNNSNTDNNSNSSSNTSNNNSSSSNNNGSSYTKNNLSSNKGSVSKTGDNVSTTIALTSGLIAIVSFGTLTTIAIKNRKKKNC